MASIARITMNLVREHQSDNRPRIRRVAPAPFADRRIMIAIASYRDPDLADTVLSALHQAAYPEHLRFAICHQYDEDVRGLLGPWVEDPRFSIDELPHNESRGCCWARSRTFDLYDDEPYLLQIGAHTRFAARWDVRFIEMLESIDADLPFITTYPSEFTVNDDGSITYDLERTLPTLDVRECRPDLITLQPTTIADAISPLGSSPTLGAGHIFTRGRFCRDVPYDPNMSLAGADLSMAARAFTTGYDLYAPNEMLLWRLNSHDHTANRDDHDDNGDHTAAHGDHTAAHGDHDVAQGDAMSRLQTLFRGDSTDLGRYGLGTIRSLNEFGRAAAIRSAAASPQRDLGVVIDIDRSAIHPRDDYDHFLVTFLDRLGNEVTSRSIHAPDVLDLTRASVTFHDLDAEGATAYSVLPVQRNGILGTPVLRQIEGR